VKKVTGNHESTTVFCHVQCQTRKKFETLLYRVRGLRKYQHWKNIKKKETQSLIVYILIFFNY